MRILTLLATGACVLALTSCRSKSKGDAPITVKAADGAELVVITQHPNCRRPSLSPRGRRLLTICDHQKTHAHPQLYLVDVASGESRRLTWQDGEVTEALWVDENRVAYASTTDEIKERLFRTEARPSRELPTELYTSDLFGNEIVRLTENPGLDGEMTLEDSELSYVVSRDGKRELWRRDLSRPDVPAKLVPLRESGFHHPVALPRRRWLWLATTDATQEKFTLRWFGPEAPPVGAIAHPAMLRRTGGGQGVLIVERGAKGDQLNWLAADWKCLKTIWNEESRIDSADLVEGPEPLLALSRVTPTGSRLQLLRLSPDTLSCPTAESGSKLSP